jgi:hypothetical protein
MADSTENCEQNLTIKVFDTGQKVSGVLATNNVINTPEQGIDQCEQTRPATQGLCLRQSISIWTLEILVKVVRKVADSVATIQTVKIREQKHSEQLKSAQ